MTIRTTTAALSACALTLMFAGDAGATASLSKTDLQAICFYNNQELGTGRIPLSRTATMMSHGQFDAARASHCLNGGTAHARGEPDAPRGTSAPASAPETTPAPTP